MEDAHTIQGRSSQADNPGRWLAAYLHNRAHLASYKSDFQCDPRCTRPGCNSLDLQVPVSLIDVWGAARYRDEPVAAAYRDHYSLGLLANDRDDWIRIVTLKLTKPCPFLESDRCSIYPVRPLPCILFPEYLVNEGTFEANAGKDHFKDYLCFKRPVALSPDRARAMTHLKKLWRREGLISSFYLFNHGRCHIDFSNLLEELAGEAGGPEPPGVIPHRVIEDFFLRHMAGCAPFAGVEEKIAQVDTREGQREFFRLFHDERLMKQLTQGRNDRALVFRYVKGNLQARRRSISPPEYKYY